MSGAFVADKVFGEDRWYWNLQAAQYAFAYAELARMGVDVMAASQLVSAHIDAHIDAVSAHIDAVSAHFDGELRCTRDTAAYCTHITRCRHTAHILHAAWTGMLHAARMLHATRMLHAARMLHPA
jgi:hypothetical protein